jgi:hypothetical protein
MKVKFLKLSLIKKCRTVDTKAIEGRKLPMVGFSHPALNPKQEDEISSIDLINYI